MSAGNGIIPNNGHSKHSGRRNKKMSDYCERAIELATLGLSQAAIADSLDIHPITLIRWKNNDANFANAIKRGYAICKESKVKRIAKAGEKNWQADAWLLERRFPDEFARRENVRVGDPEGKPLATAVIAPTVNFIIPANDRSREPAGNGR